MVYFVSNTCREGIVLVNMYKNKEELRSAAIEHLTAPGIVDSLSVTDIFDKEIYVNKGIKIIEEEEKIENIETLTTEELIDILFELESITIGKEHDGWCNVCDGETGKIIEYDAYKYWC
jgi:hypothetical protein